jgi:IS5 family transposase
MERIAGVGHSAIVRLDVAAVVGLESTPPSYDARSSCRHRRDRARDRWLCDRQLGFGFEHHIFVNKDFKVVGAE